MLLRSSWNFTQNDFVISLAILGCKPAFAERLHVGRPNIGDREVMLRRLGEVFDRRWFTNDGPLVKEFEARIQELIGVKLVRRHVNGIPSRWRLPSALWNYEVK